MSRYSAPKDVFQAIADPTRRAILGLLCSGEQPVMALAREFAVSLSAISQHMRVLREVGLVTVRQSGRERLYRLNPEPLREVAAWVEEYEQFWQARLDALGEHLEKNP